MKPLSNCTPSVMSSSVASVDDSSTVMTPSSPIFSTASPNMAPMSGSRDVTVPTWAMLSRPLTGVALDLSSSTTLSAAAWIPRPSAVGLAPAATLRRPTFTNACANTVAVVVPSPATSLVWVATFLASCAPRFSNGSSSSTSRATVTPSRVTVGPPNFLSSTTCRPLGPRVTLTASASLFTPRSSDRRATSSKLICLGIRTSLGESAKRRGTPADAGARGVHRVSRLSVDDSQHVAGGQDQVLLTVVLDLGAAVLGVDNDVAHLDIQGDAVALVVDAARAHGQNLALLGLLLSSVGDDEAGSRRLLGLARLDNNPVLERLDVHAHRCDLHGSSKALAGT